MDTVALCATDGVTSTYCPGDPFEGAALRRCSCYALDAASSVAFRPHGVLDDRSRTCIYHRASQAFSSISKVGADKLTIRFNDACRWLDDSVRGTLSARTGTAGTAKCHAFQGLPHVPAKKKSHDGRQSPRVRAVIDPTGRFFAL